MISIRKVNIKHIFKYFVNNNYCIYNISILKYNTSESEAEKKQILELESMWSE